jgi:hypothetical protein
MNWKFSIFLYKVLKTFYTAVYYYYFPFLVVFLPHNDEKWIKEIIERFEANGFMRILLRRHTYCSKKG